MPCFPPINSLQVAHILMEARLETCQMELSDRLSSLDREIAAAKMKTSRIESSIRLWLSAALISPVYYASDGSKETTEVSSVSW